MSTRATRRPRSSWLISRAVERSPDAQLLLGEVSALAGTNEVVAEGCGYVDYRRSPTQPGEQAVQRLMLGSDAAVLVALIDDPGEVLDYYAHVCIGHDHQLVQGRQKARIDGPLAL